MEKGIGQRREVDSEWKSPAASRKSSIPFGNRRFGNARALFRRETRVCQRQIPISIRIGPFLRERSSFPNGNPVSHLPRRGFRSETRLSPWRLRHSGWIRGCAGGDTSIPNGNSVMRRQVPFFTRKSGLTAARPSIRSDCPIAKRAAQDSGRRSRSAAHGTAAPAEVAVAPPASPDFRTESESWRWHALFSRRKRAHAARRTGFPGGEGLAPLGKRLFLLETRCGKPRHRSSSRKSVRCGCRGRCSARSRSDRRGHGRARPEIAPAGPARGRSPAGLRLSAVKTAFCPPGSPGAQVTIRSGRRRRRVVRSPRRPPGRR